MQVKKISILTVTLVASLGGFLFGFDIAVVSGVLPLLKKQFDFSAFQEGMFVSSALIGCIVGVAFSGELTDKVGRKKPLILSAVLFLLSGIGCLIAPSLTMVTLSRFIGGVGIGLASNVVPLYISEIAPARSRGRLITYYQFAVTLGIVVAYLTNAGLLNYALEHSSTATAGLFASVTTTEVWRAMLGLGSVPALLFLFGLFSLPESPRWLYQRGRVEEAKAVLAATGMEDETQSISHTTKEKVSYRELLSPRWRKALLIGLLLPLFSQFSGINAIFYYGPGILNDAGISLSDSYMTQVILGAANMLFTLIAIWKVDSAGRRPLYLAGTAGATIMLIGTGFCFLTGATSMLLLFFVLGFLACFAFSIGPLKFVVAAEIFPNKIRGRAMALSIMVMWIADTIVGYLTPVLLKSIGTPATFWLFAGFCAIAFVVVYKMLPETKGKSLEQIEAEWKGKQPGGMAAGLSADNLLTKTP